MPGPPYPDVSSGTGTRGPRYGAGDFFDNRGQFLKQLKRDKGEPFPVDDISDAIPLITRGKSFVWGMIDGNKGIRNNSINGSDKIQFASMDITKIIKGATNTALVSGGLVPLWRLIVGGNIDPAADIAYTQLAAAPCTKCMNANPTAGGAMVSGTTYTATWFSDETGVNATYYTYTGPANARTGFTINVSGWYLITANVFWPPNAAQAGFRQIGLMLGGTGITFINHLPTANSFSTGQGTTWIGRVGAPMNVSLNVQHTQGANQAFASDNRHLLSATYLGHL